MYTEKDRGRDISISGLILFINEDPENDERGAHHDEDEMIDLAGREREIEEIKLEHYKQNSRYTIGSSISCIH